LRPFGEIFTARRWKGLKETLQVRPFYALFKTSTVDFNISKLFFEKKTSTAKVKKFDLKLPFWRET
jgi:hypothetical protein